MSRIQTTFSQLAEQKRKALITFITAGDPAPELTVPLLHALVAGGVDILELGVPFSDPMAEGPVIQRACERALKFGISTHDVLGYVREFRKTNTHTPIVLMGYANPIEHYGSDKFVTDAAAAGVDGVLVVDYPPEECEGFARSLQDAGMDPIFLLAPTSTEARMRQVGRMASGYVYYVSLKGVTGAGHLDTASVAQALPRIRANVNVPVGVGFGIRDAATAQAVARVCDGVVIGSSLVQLLEKCMLDHKSPEEIVRAAAAWVADIRRALDELERASR